MYPVIVALLETAEAGLLYFRRFMSVYNTAATALDAGSTITEFFDNELRYHRRVEGEEVYLFLLGRTTVSSLLKGEGLTQREIDEAVVLAIISSLEYRGSNDVRNTIIAFAYHLGQIAQALDDQFLTRANAALSSINDGTEVSDPVYELLNEYKGAVPIEAKAILYEMGITSPLFPAMYESLSQKGIITEWLTSIDAPAALGRKIHKSQTFLGQVVRGARSIAGESLLAAPITTGPDGLYLNLFGLGNLEPLYLIRETLPDVRTITREMVNITASREMKRRGYVQVEGGGWALRTNTVYEAEDPIKNTGRKVYRVKDENQQVDIGQAATDRATSKLKSAVKSKVIDKILSSGKKFAASRAAKSLGGK